MPKRIDETLKKLAENMSRASSPITSSTDQPQVDPVKSSEINLRASDLPGDPNCPICAGIGYIRLEVPVGHPDFGRLQPCTCRNWQISQQVLDRLYSLSNLSELHGLTFETFMVRGRVGLAPRQADSLEQAYNLARLYAQSPRGWLVLHGGYGCGKTHLAAAIANQAVSLGMPTLFLTVPDLLDALRFAYDDPQATFEERFIEIRDAGLLVLDDFGTQNATAWAQEKLFQIINYRYINRLPTIVTTNLPFNLIEGRIRSRMEDPELVTQVRILATDFRRPMGDLGQHELSSLDLHRDQTFNSFDRRKHDNLSTGDKRNLEDAYQNAFTYAQNLHGWLVLIGSHGGGKTHLAAAVGNYREEKGEELIFAYVPELLDRLRATFNTESTVSLNRLLEDYKSTPLLILDDLSMQSSTPWAREKLYQLINYRYDAKLPTVITTSETLEAMDPKLSSRIMDKRLCEVLAIVAPDYRGGGPAKPKSYPKNRV